MALSLMKSNLLVSQAQSKDMHLIQDLASLMVKPLIPVSKLSFVKVKILKQMVNYVI